MSIPVVASTFAALDDALSAQGPELGPLVVEADLRTGVERALESDCDWIWVLDGASVPRPGALDALLAGLDRVGDLPPPSLMTGMIVTPDGRAHPRRTPWYRRFHLETALHSVEHQLLPVRGSGGPVLVHRGAAAADPPRPGAPVAVGSLLEWSVRVLRLRHGYLVPDSESVADGGDGDPLLAPATALRLLTGPGLVRLDRLALVLELFERAGSARR